MKKFTVIKHAVYFVVTLLAVSTSYAQLPAFTITATSTPQSCSGNGSISFTTNGTDPAASLDYALFLLPNTTTPVVTTATSPILNVAAGNYLLVATQSLGPDSNTSSTSVTVGSTGQQLEYTLAPTSVRCGNDGKITVNVTQGTATFYEIIAGPVTAPMQTSNVFENLPVGVYQVRVHDVCGDALVVTIQVSAINPFLSLGPRLPQGGPLPSCNVITMGHAFNTTTGSQIFYPVTMEYTIFPPGGGAPQVVTYTVANGPSGLPGNTGPVYNNIPFFHGQAYTYNLEVTDACGNVFFRNNNQVNISFDVLVLPGTEGCDENTFTFTPNFFVPPYTVNFISAPAGFVPGNFNAAYPTHAGETTYGAAGNSVPDGTYTVEFTDSCGRTVTKTFETSDPEVTPQVIPNVDGCATEGGLEIGVPGRTIVAIQITAAPAGYPQPLPQDVAFAINGDGGWEMDNMPLGTYTFVLEDSCGQIHTITAELEVFGTEPDLQVLQRPGCEEGFGSVRIRDMGANLISVIITSAPAAYTQTQTLPHNVSANISAGNGMFYMNTLPAGAYTIDIINECGQTSTFPFTVEGYQPTVNNFVIDELCGSFNLHMQHSSNGDYLQTFWLQEFNPDTNTWGHPGTGVVYTEGTAPTAANSIVLNTSANPNPNNPTLPYTGIFRVIKVFHTYSNGSAANFRCVDVLHNFEYTGRPDISDVYVFPCSAGLSEAAVEAVGVEPLTYSIVATDDTVILDNGTSSLFSGLASGTYRFRVTDACGNLDHFIKDITEFEEMEITAVNLCEGEQGRLSVPQFSFLTYEWYEQDTPGTIISTTNTMSLAPFDSAIHPGTYVVHIVSTAQGSCIDETIEYVVSPNSIPNAGDDDTVIVCNEGDQLDLTIYLSAGHQAGGTWADINGTGALAGDMLDTAGLATGMYQFTYSVAGDCGLVDDASITIDLRTIPGAPTVANVPALCEGGTIQLSVDAVADAVYQWTGPDNFTSTEQNPVIASATEAANGNYTVIVTVNGCSSPPSQTPVSVNAIPDFTVSGNAEICIGQSGEINVIAENFDPNAAAVSYQWYYEGVLQPANTANIIIDEIGAYEVIVTNGICTAPPKQFTVTENNDAFEVLLEDGCRDFEYIISVLNFESIPGAVYEWTGPDGVLAGQTGPEVNITEMTAGLYTVSIENADGCVKTASVDVTNTFCKIPRGISPSVDEINDKFDLSNLNVQHLQIFNRYGIEVYNKENYIDEWHGQSDKGDLPSGTYYYVAALSTGRQVTGWVYLQRQN